VFPNQECTEGDFLEDTVLRVGVILSAGLVLLGLSGCTPMWPQAEESHFQRSLEAMSQDPERLIESSLPKNGPPNGHTGSWEYKWDNGRVAAEVEYVNGIKSGKARGWYPSGKLAFEGEYEKDLRSGTRVKYYESGAKYCEAHYQGGSLNGGYDEWHENGQKYSEGQYQRGQKIGVWRYWYANGKPMRGASE